MSQSEAAIVGLGARTDYLAQVPNADPLRLRLTAEEGALWARIGRASRIDELILHSGLDEPRAIALLLSLRAKGAVVPARVNKPSGPQVVDAASVEQVDLPADRKQEILDLERGLGRLDHYAVLGLRPGATLEEIRQAYYAASRRYHPDRYYGKNLGSFRGRIDRIFRRIAEAYQTLSDDEKRAAYLRARPELAGRPQAEAAAAGANGLEGAEAPVDPERAAERRARMARHPYLARVTRVAEFVQRARAHIAQEQPGLALTDLHMAAQMEPGNKEVEYLQAEARRRFDLQRAKQELQKAAEAERFGDTARALGHYRTAATLDATSFQAAYRAAGLLRQQGADAKELRSFAQRAVDLDPKSADARLLMAQVLLDADLKKLAKKQLEEAAKLQPDHPEVKKQLKRMRWPF